MKRLLWLVPLLAAAAAAPEIAGKWSGAIEVADGSSGTTINTRVRAEFEQKSDLISGRIGRQQDEVTEPIRNAKLEGNHFSFEVTSPETTGAIKFDLTVNGDLIEGQMKGNIDTGPITGKVRLQRQP